MGEGKFTSNCISSKLFVKVSSSKAFLQLKKMLSGIVLP